MCKSPLQSLLLFLGGGEFRMQIFTPSANIVLWCLIKELIRSYCLVSSQLTYPVVHPEFTAGPLGVGNWKLKQRKARSLLSVTGQTARHGMTCSFWRRWVLCWAWLPLIAYCFWLRACSLRPGILPSTCVTGLHSWMNQKPAWRGEQLSGHGETGCSHSTAILLRYISLPP